MQEGAFGGGSVSEADIKNANFSHVCEHCDRSFGDTNFQQCGNNSLRTTEGAHRAEQWHVDPPIWFPTPPGMTRHDPRIEMPIFWLTVQMAITDIGPADGPTEYVLGSHYSGRDPPLEEPPVLADDPRLNFDGRPPHTVLCKAGDIYLHHSQTWHRGTVNTSGKMRYLHQQQCEPPTCISLVSPCVVCRECRRFACRRAIVALQSIFYFCAPAEPQHTS
jgi:hypothetical protein